MKAPLADLKTALATRCNDMEAVIAGLRSNPDATDANPGIVVAASRLEDILRKDKAALEGFGAFEKRVLESPDGVAATIAERIANGDLFDKATHTAAVTAAEEKGEKTINDRIAAEKQKSQKIAANRETIKTAHGEVAAAALSDEVLGDENFAGVVAPEVGRRVAALTSAGITAESKKDSFTSMLTVAAFTADGGKIFDGAVGTVRGALGLKEGENAKITPAAKPAHAAASHVPPVNSGGGENRSDTDADSSEVQFAM